MAVATLFVFLTTACNMLSHTVNVESNPWLVVQQCEVPVPLPVQLPKAVKEIGIFALLRSLHYDAFYGCVLLERVEEVLWSDEDSPGWLIGLAYS